MAGSAADFWVGAQNNLPVVNANGNIFEEAQVATAGQTVFTLLSFTYTPGQKSIFVYRKTAADAGIGAEMLRRAVDYTETASNKITLTVGAVVGDTLIFVGYGVNQLIAPVVNNGIPQGGATGAILQKNSASDYDAAWTPQSSVTTLLDALRQNIASASSINLIAIAGATRNIQITGSIQIDGFQVVAGQVWVVKFQSALTVSNNGNIVTGTGAALAVNANASCILRAIADNAVEIISYTNPAGDVLIGSINSGPVGGRRNFFYNAGFQNSQRGAQIFAASGTVIACDGWGLTIAATTVTATATQVATVTGNQSGFALDVAALNTTGTGSVAIFQRIEAKNSKKLSGKTVTVSGKISHTVGSTLNVNCGFIRPTATDNYAGTAAISGTGATPIPSGVVTPFNFTVVMGATDCDLGLEVDINLPGIPPQAGSTILFMDMQLEIGSVATPFEHQTAAMADIESKRLLYCTNNGTPKGAAVGSHSGVAISTTLLICPLHYPVAMRAIPTIQLWQNGTQNQLRNTGTGAVVANTIATISGHNINGFALIGFVTANLVVGNGYEFDLIASSEM